MSKETHKARGHGPMGGMRSEEKAKDFKGTWIKLIEYSKKYRPLLLMGLIFASGGAILSLAGPSMLSNITDKIIEGMMGEIDLAAITTIGITLSIIYGISLLLNYSQRFIFATAAQRISKQMRKDLSKKINRLPLNYFDRNSFGDVLSRATNDVDRIGQTLNQSLSTLANSITLLVGAVIMMLITNLVMTVAAIVSAIMGFILMMVIIKKTQKYFKVQQKSLGEINGLVEESYSGHNIVKAYNAGYGLKKEFNEINEELFKSAWKSQFFSGIMMPLMTFIGNLGYVAVCVTGAVLVINGDITIGVIVAFMVYVRLFTQPLAQIAQAATSLQSTAAAGERVFEFLNEEELPEEIENTKEIKKATGKVEFEDVKFGYVEGQAVIKDFSVKVNSGDKIAIVGPTGAGKTTLVNLIMRFYEIDGGVIKIDDTPIHDIKRENLHDQFSMVLQDSWLFEGTVRENIRFNNDKITDEEMVNACKTLGIHHFIMTLSKGYDTVLDGHANISQGQRQLITIARAMVENAPILILDEATSSVDTRTEELIQIAMDKLSEGRTAFIIAHRLSTIRNADMILVINEGDIIEKGSHDELMEQDGFYADLYNSQFEEV
ncbi:MAG: ABC transporter ATP-binding protein [Peptostreptococcaceae bacterium]|nr:ABC transporter ATP-binding protein [Peptostreptococcaceae bacterium]